MSVMSAIHRAQRAVVYVKMRILHTILKPIARRMYGGRHIWIVSERGTDARDNGYHFYRYLRKSHPEQEAYYIIDRSSADYPKVAALGQAVDRGSLKHWLLYLGAEVKISTHINGFLPERNWHYEKLLSQKTDDAKTVFLQHGVIKDDLIGCYKDRANVSLFICGAKPEYDYILPRFGYSERELKYTGLARFDGLYDCTVRRQVLIMPTWRSWLSLDSAQVTFQTVQSSRYIKEWSSLLKSVELERLAQQYGVSFVFYPHHEIQPFLHLFEGADACVAIADFAHFDIQELLKESMLLITDYSSVFFDFAYMQKPVLYYQFDEDEYRAHHYAQGYFDYRRDGFGEVVTDEAALLDLLERYLAEDCHMRPEYRRRIEGFFPLHDNHNCERIYLEIHKLK